MKASAIRGVSFGREHFGVAPLGDERLTRRLVHCADRILQHPEGRFPDKFQDPTDLDSFYRLPVGRPGGPRWRWPGRRCTSCRRVSAAARSAASPCACGRCASGK